MHAAETASLPTLRSPVEPLWRFEAGGGEIVGTCHNQSEDYKMIGRSSDIAVVCDGIGGAPKGSLAAELACKVAVRSYERGLTLDAAIRSAGNAVSRVGDWLAVPNMGCSIAALTFEGNRAHVAWLGDTLVFRLRKGKLKRLTRPDRITGTNRLAECLVAKMPMATVPHELLSEIEKDDLYLICSDGVWSELGESHIAEALLEHSGHAMKAARALLDRLSYDSSDSRGPSDDATLVTLVATGRVVADAR